jgi:uncharacterized repeat protein (TIGR01451 family)
VTTTADTMDGNTASVAALIAGPGSDGRISLREALVATNNTAGADTIRFGIPLADAGHFYYKDNGAVGFGTEVVTTLADLSTPSSPVLVDFDADYPAGHARSWYRIQPTSALPSITGAIILDATTQPLSLVGGGQVVELNAALAGAIRALDLVANSSGSTIRGLAVNRSPGPAINILAGSSSNVIAGNYLGTDVSDTLPKGNAVGVFVESTNNRIGDTMAAEQNIVSGNAVDKIQITDAGATNNVVQGNYVGLDVSGTIDVGNTGTGVAIYGGAVDSAVGGIVPGAGNVISGNNIGIGVSHPGTVGSPEEPIGTNAGHGRHPQWPRHLPSVLRPAPRSAAPGRRQPYRYNRSGSWPATAAPKSITATRSTRTAHWHRPERDGVTDNDAGDADTGANDLLNFPSMTSAFGSAFLVIANFTLDVPAGSYRIEFFRNSGADASGHGEGEVFVSSLNVTHPGGGAVPFSHIFPGSIGDVITATTTACSDGAACAAFGDTSEFGAAVVATLTTVDLTLSKSDAPDPADLGGLLTYTLGAVNGGSSDATGVTLTDTLPQDMTFEAATPSQGTCNFTIATRTLSCNLGAIGPLASATVVLQVRPWAARTFTNTALVIANEDPGPNTATQQTTVEIPTRAPVLHRDLDERAERRRVPQSRRQLQKHEHGRQGQTGRLSDRSRRRSRGDLACVPDPTTRRSAPARILPDRRDHLLLRGLRAGGAAPGRFATWGRLWHPTNEPAVKWAFSTGALASRLLVSEQGVIATQRPGRTRCSGGRTRRRPTRPGQYGRRMRCHRGLAANPAGSVVQSRSPFCTRQVRWSRIRSTWGPRTARRTR